MKLVAMFGMAALLLVSNGVTLSAQSARQPGQLGTSFQLQSDAKLQSYSVGVLPKTSIATVNDSHERFVNRLWIASLVSAAAGTSLDAVSSWHKQEGNALLASSDARFGSKGVAIKAGCAAALIIPQICLRKHKELKTAFTIGNFAEAAIFTGVSVHNFQVRNYNSQ